MIDFYFWPTPNGQKIAIALEEMSLPYKVFPVDISNGAQFEPEYLKISPNNKMPAIVDHQPKDSGGPLSVFESAAILLYLSEKTGRFAGTDLRSRVAVQEWLSWQVAGLGPMLGQANHFVVHAKEKIPYAIDRYTEEAKRLRGVMQRRLTQTKYLAGNEYTVADMASYSWSLNFERLNISLAEAPALKRWIDDVGDRPAVQRGMALKP